MRRAGGECGADGLPAPAQDDWPAGECGRVGGGGSDGGYSCDSLPSSPSPRAHPLRRRQCLRLYLAAGIYPVTHARPYFTLLHPRPPPYTPPRRAKGAGPAACPAYGGGERERPAPLRSAPALPRRGVPGPGESGGARPADPGPPPGPGPPSRPTALSPSPGARPAPGDRLGARGRWRKVFNKCGRPARHTHTTPPAPSLALEYYL